MAGGAFRFGHKRPRQTKFGNFKTGGLSSKLEYAVHHLLLKRQAAGEIKDIKLQQPIVLIDGPRTQKITWKVDFSFVRVSNNQLEYVEAKGFPTDVYKMKLKMFRSNSQAPLEIWGGNYTKPILIERIEMRDNNA